MIYLEQLTGNTIALTLSEMSTLVNPFYYIELINCQTLTSTIYKLSGDTSAYKDRINIYNLNLSADTSAGYYDYNVYETTGSTYTTDLNIVEFGKMLFKTPEKNVYEYKPIETNYVYRD